MAMPRKPCRSPAIAHLRPSWSSSFRRSGRAVTATTCRLDLAPLRRSLCANRGWIECELPRPSVGTWLAKQPHESAKTQQCRISVVRQFALYLCRLGYRADVPDRALAPSPADHLLAAHSDARRDSAIT